MESPLLALAAFAILFTYGLGAWSAAPWVPTRRRERSAVARGFNLKPGALVGDLGCGDGAMLFAVCDEHPGVRALGYEIALPPLLMGWWRRWRGGARYKDVSLRWRDFWGRDLSALDAVFVFLMRTAYPRLVPKLARELRDDAQIIVECWPFDGVAHVRKIGGEGGMLPYYVYTGAALKAAAARAGA